VRTLERTILHCDLNGFYASVECIFRPELRDVPMAVAGNPENRHGIILAKNELAKKYKVQTAETIWQAKKKCPDLVLVPPHHGEYEKYSKLVNKIYEEFTDLVEPFGIDESWLDVTGVYNLFGSGVEIADKIRAIVKERLGLTISVGVSFNKIFAKLGSDYKKPDATTVISYDNYKKIVWPLHVSDLLYVGKAAREALSKMYINTIGDLANSNKENIVKRLGKMGEMIHNYANGIDDSPVKSVLEKRDVKSVGNGTTFDHDIVGFDEIRTEVLGLADEVASRMRRYGMKCYVISVMIKNPSFKSISRQKTLISATNITKEIAEVSMELIRSCWNEKAPIRAITVTGAHLTSSENAIEQLTLFNDNDNCSKEKLEKLDNVVDKIREKYGKKSIGLGNLIKDDIISKEE
jgi:DNA polymerase-4